MFTIRFHRLAAKEFRAAKSWYSARIAEVAERFLESVNTAALRIQQDPASHAVEVDQIRWARVKRFPYRLIFETTTAESVLVLAVAHTSRRARYWRRRT